MSSVSTFLAVVIPVKQRLSFLDLPPEIRYMIYNDVLPDVIRVQPHNDSGLAILRTSRQIYEEAFNILKKRTSLDLKVEDRQAHLLAHRWINLLVGRGVSGIRHLGIEVWIEVDREPNTVMFERQFFSMSLGSAPSGFAIKSMMPGCEGFKEYKYEEAGQIDDPQQKTSSALSYQDDCLATRPTFHEEFVKVMFKLFGKEETSDGIMHKSGLRMIVDTIIDYSEYSYLRRPRKAWNVGEVRLIDVRYSIPRSQFQKMNGTGSISRHALQDLNSKLTIRRWKESSRFWDEVDHLAESQLLHHILPHVLKSLDREIAEKDELE
ncbi:MAG: hypothetical protein Q9179_006389 [Wetmoreana sp. 5 TL-2023]